MSRPRFHLAIPVSDIPAARAFYGGVLGLSEGRSADSWVDWDFYGHQVVTHLAPRNPTARESGDEAVAYSSVDGKQVPVPHFGLVLSISSFDDIAQKLKTAGADFVIEPYLRFEGKPGEQWTMFTLDGVGNALEFKAFAEESQIFAK